MQALNDHALTQNALAAAPLRQAPRDGEVFDFIAQALERDGCAVLPAVVPDSVTDGLFMELKALDEAEFKTAGIGRQDDFQVNRFVRSDKICWLKGESDASVAFLTWMEQLRHELNRRLFLGLFDYECHYASYSVGAFYKKHLDAFKGQSNRVLSTVFYLNPNWTSADGGELVLFDEAGEQVLQSVVPAYGKLVIFLSEVFPHEVLPSLRPRHSIAGWFRVNNNSALNLDPPR